MRNNDMNLEKGSEWRRWELHIHTPGTQKNDNFDGTTSDDKWKKYYEDIDTYIGSGNDPLKNIAVIAITDYLSIDNYKKVIADNKLPTSIKLVLPNVEMRIQPIANDSPINIPFIKRKKKDRQIIIVTHNANVVLGSDAEEVIVANQQGSNVPNKQYRFEYRSGAIENNTPLYGDNGDIEPGILNSQGIQQHICDILEGGERAFELRKNKYHI